MHLKVYKTEEQKDAQGNVVGAKTLGEEARTITNIKTLTFEFDRGTFTVVHRPGGGPMVTETGELQTLYKEGKESNSFFESYSESGKATVKSAVGHLVDPTTVPTYPITSAKEVDKKK